jgi:hypothetical protein
MNEEMAPFGLEHAANRCAVGVHRERGFSLARGCRVDPTGPYRSGGCSPCLAQTRRARTKVKRFI